MSRRDDDEELWQDDDDDFDFDDDFDDEEEDEDEATPAAATAKAGASASASAAAKPRTKPTAMRAADASYFLGLGARLTNAKHPDESWLTTLALYLLVFALGYLLLKLYLSVFGGFFQHSAYRVLPALLGLALFLLYVHVAAGAGGGGGGGAVTTTPAAGGGGSLSGSWSWTSLTYLLLRLAGVVGAAWLLNRAFGASSGGNSGSIWITVVFYVLLVLAVPSFLFLVYLLAKHRIEEIKRGNDVYAFALQLLFYLPCLWGDLWTYLAEEARRTSRREWTLLGIELAILGCACFGRRASAWLQSLADKTGDAVAGTRTDTLVLLEKPTFLDRRRVLARNQFGAGAGAGAEVKRITYLDPRVMTGPGNSSADVAWLWNNLASSFSLSLWIFPNHLHNIEEDSSAEVEVLRYGDAASFHPKLVFDSRAQSLRLVYHAAAAPEQQPPSFRFELQPQRWHHLVFSYSESVFDLFVDGELARSKRLASRRLAPRFAMEDEISVGAETDHLADWALDRVAYHYHPLTAFQVAAAFNAGRER